MKESRGPSKWKTSSFMETKNKTERGLEQNEHHRVSQSANKNRVNRAEHAHENS